MVFLSTCMCSPYTWTGFMYEYFLHTEISNSLNFEKAFNYLPLNVKTQKIVYKKNYNVASCFAFGWKLVPRTKRESNHCVWRAINCSYVYLLMSPKLFENTVLVEESVFKRGKRYEYEGNWITKSCTICTLRQLWSEFSNQGKWNGWFV